MANSRPPDDGSSQSPRRRRDKVANAGGLEALGQQLEADMVHVMVDGRIVATGDADLALQLEQTGYAGYSK